MDPSTPSNREMSSGAFPHYHQPYRGLPAEIRLEIWRHCFCDELVVNPNQSLEISHCLREQRGKEGQGVLISRESWIKWKAISNKDAFNLSIFMLNKEIRADAVALTEQTVMWKFAWAIHDKLVSQFFSDIGPFMRHITRGVNIAATSLTWFDHHECRKRNITPFNLTSTLDHLHELVIRLTPRATASAERSPLFRSGAGEDLDTRVDHDLLDDQLRMHLCGFDILYTLHYFLERDEISVIKLTHDQAYEGLRSFFSSSLDVKLGNPEAPMYITMKAVNALDVELDWPVGSGELTLCFTKKRTHATEAT